MEIKEKNWLKRHPVLSVVGIVLGLGLIGILLSPESKENRRIDPKKAEVAAENLKKCKKAMEKGASMGALQDLKGKGDHAEAIVGPAFYAIPFEEKQRLIEAVSCIAVNGDPEGLINIDLIDRNSGKKIGAFWGGELKIY